MINALCLMIEEWTVSFDKVGVFGALLSDLSKALHCLPHELLITKRHTCRVDMPSLKLLHLYLTSQKRSHIK